MKGIIEGIPKKALIAFVVCFGILTTGFVGIEMVRGFYSSVDEAITEPIKEKTEEVLDAVIPVEQVRGSAEKFLVKSDSSMSTFIDSFDIKEVTIDGTGIHWNR